jgi:hypothetical protein
MRSIRGAASHAENEEPAPTLANLPEKVRRALDLIGVQGLDDAPDFGQVLPGEGQMPVRAAAVGDKYARRV